jgi:hypothetical protein
MLAIGVVHHQFTAVVILGRRDEQSRVYVGPKARIDATANGIVLRTEVMAAPKRLNCGDEICFGMTADMNRLLRNNAVITMPASSCASGEFFGS